MKTLGLVANVYNEANALPGWLETHTPFFDHILVYHSGPNGERSIDGTIEILEKWKIPVVFGSINEGYGAIRTQAIRLSPCDWVMLLDADERFYALNQVLTCSGESTPRAEVDKLLYDYGDPNYKEPEIVQEYDKGIDFTACPSNFENLKRLGANLNVTYGEVYNQGAWLRDIIEHGDLDAVKTIRRHWHDFTRKRPTQNWHTDADFQMRLVRNKESIFFDASVKMHERLQGASNVYNPNMTHGPFFDHFHCFFKPMEATQRRHDVSVYDSISKGETPLSFEEFSKR